MQSPNRTALLAAPVGWLGIWLNRLVSRAGASIVTSQARDPPPARREGGGGKVPHRKECYMEWGGVRAARRRRIAELAGRARSERGGWIRWKGLVTEEEEEGSGSVGRRGA